MHNNGKPLRVLQVFSRMDIGGAETMVMNLFRKLERDKICFDFAVNVEQTCAYDAEIKELGGNIYRLPKLKNGNIHAYKSAWREFLKQHPYPIVHGHLRSTAALYLPEAKRSGAVAIAHSHSISAGEGFSALAKNILQYPIRFQADYLCACSRAAGLWLYGKNAVNKANFRIMPNAIDTPAYRINQAARSKLRGELGIAENTLLIGHVGRFSFPKNHTYLLDIFNEIHNMQPDSKLILAGAGELLDETKAKAARLGLTDSVIFAGLRKDIPLLMQAMDVLVFPSRYEGLPVTLVEAQAADLPCIISDVISSEVCFSPLVQRLSLQAAPAEWAAAAIQAAKSTLRAQHVGFASVLSNGYDVSEAAAKLQEFYFSVLLSR
ncbi:MAG: glycosyltransferase family 1 protein [Oscillospiraceae bacterium]|jgi:glycosyltransferase involved in cell wall biosynthesis|nr:glycosyltransferase family 1 protein [Oscillospiraceae bacterium]